MLVLECKKGHRERNTHDQCVPCKREANRNWYKRNRAESLARVRKWREQNPERARGKDLMRLYGITLSQYDALLERQGGACAACKAKKPGLRNLDVDHDHSCCPSRKSCGKCIRGLLCSDCNKGLGHFGDDPDKLIAAAEYLRNGSN